MACRRSDVQLTTFLHARRHLLGPSAQNIGSTWLDGYVQPPLVAQNPPNKFFYGNLKITQSPEECNYLAEIGHMWCFGQLIFEPSKNSMGVQTEIMLLCFDNLNINLD